MKRCHGNHSVILCCGVCFLAELQWWCRGKGSRCSTEGYSPEEASVPSGLYDPREQAPRFSLDLTFLNSKKQATVSQSMASWPSALTNSQSPGTHLRPTVRVSRGGCDTHQSLRATGGAVRLVKMFSASQWVKDNTEATLVGAGVSGSELTQPPSTLNWLQGIPGFPRAQFENHWTR